MNAATSTTTRKPTNGDRERMDGNRNADIVLGAAVIAMGLLAGLFYAFDVAVMPALTAADDRTLVDAMQQMIDKIENPAFFLTLLGAPALAAVALSQARRSGSAKTAGWIVAALAFYAVTVAVTFAFHFPLNDELKKAGDPAPHRGSRRCARRLRHPLGRLEHRPDAGIDGGLRLPYLGARLARTRGRAERANRGLGATARPR